MKWKPDIHDFNHRLVLAERLASKSNPITAKNSRLITKFEDYCVSAGLSKVRVTKYLLTLKKLAEWLDKDFDAAGKEDLERLVNALEKSDRSPWTKRDYKVALKKFYKWLRGGEARAIFR